MCGITAVFSRRSDVASDTMSAGTAAPNHRGPDGRQHWISPDGRVGLGHARLSIIVQDTLRSSAARDVPFLDQGKLIAMLDGIDHTNPGLAAVTDINLTAAMSYVFMHEGLRLGS